MSTALLETPEAYLDVILAGICIDLQITDSQFAEAKQKYETVGNWLSAPGSLLHGYRPAIYPQGSMALQTTVKPRKHEEFDVDLVCQVIGFIGHSMQLYQMIGDRLREHPYYRTILEPMKRCWRLNYAGDVYCRHRQKIRSENGYVMRNRRSGRETGSHGVRQET